VEALEDKRAEPRNRPPELQTNGLWDMPTLVNNVETLAWVPAILLHDASGEEATGAAPASASLGAAAGAAACTQLERRTPATSRSWYGRQGRPMGELARRLLENDTAWQQRHGAELRFPGRRLFSVSGDVVRPGVYEVENGLTVGELLELAGGVRDGQALKAIAFSGPSGGFTPAVLPRACWPRRVQQRLPAAVAQVDIRDLQLHLNYFRVWDLMLGAGIVVYGEGADLVQQACACATFFAAESCGKCVPCRLGSQKLLEWLQALLAGRIDAAQLAAYRAPDGPLADLAYTMSSTAICGLGTVAPQPLSSLLTHFPQELARYVA
jgi:NADH:ubiquinone oxidoreductase subunit F (NADH-binding)